MRGGVGWVLSTRADHSQKGEGEGRIQDAAAAQRHGNEAGLPLEIQVASESAVQRD